MKTDRQKPIIIAPKTRQNFSIAFSFDIVKTVIMKTKSEIMRNLGVYISISKEVNFANSQKVKTRVEIATKEIKNFATFEISEHLDIV